MNEKNESHKDSKKKSKGKAIPKLKDEKNTTKSVEPSCRKSIAHSGIYFKVRLKKPTDFATESRHEQVETSSFKTKENEPRGVKKEEETILLTSIKNLEISTGPAEELCDTKSHIDKRVAVNSDVSHQCQGTCKCPDNIKLLNAVFSPRHSTKSELFEDGKIAKETHSNIPLKSDRTQHKTNGVGKEKDSTRQPVCSELKPQNRILSKLRPPSDYSIKPSSAASERKRLNFTPESTTSSTPQPTSVSATQPTCTSSEPTRVSASESSTSSEPTLEGSDADKLESPPEPSSVHRSWPSSATSPDLTMSVESQTSSRPAFWPPSVPTYKIIHNLDPPTKTSSNPLSLVKCKPMSAEKSETLKATKSVPPSLCEPQSSKIAKIQKCASSSRASRIPKIPTNPATDTKKNCNPPNLKIQRNLKQAVVKTSVSDKRATTAKTICDSNEQKKLKITENKSEVPQKKSFK